MRHGSLRLGTKADSKNCVSQLRAQCGDDGELPGLLSLRHILDTIHESPSLRYLAAALSKSADSQNVPIVEALLYDQGLQVKLAMADHPLEALVLRILGHQHQAWDSPHLTRPVRCNRMANLHWLLREATLPALNGPVSELAKWANNDVKQKCLGFTTHLLFVFMANIEGHMQSMKNHPSAARLFVERAASTDDLETEFSLVVNGCGYKPSVDMIMGFLEHADFQYILRRLAGQLGIAMPKSSKVHYSHHEAAKLNDMAWNDGEFVTQPSGEAFAKYLASAKDKAMNVLGMKRDPSVRSYHVNKR